MDMLGLLLKWSIITLYYIGLHFKSSNAFNSRLGKNWKFMSILLIYNIQFTTICVFIELTILEDLTILEVTLNKNNPLALYINNDVY